LFENGQYTLPIAVHRYKAVSPALAEEGLQSKANAATPWKGVVMHNCKRCEC
jgi:hypothetical protein